MQKTPQSMHNLSVIWRGNVYSVEISSDSTVKQLGQELQKLMQVKEDTMRLIIPQSSDRSSKMLSPFSDEHGFVNLQEASIFLGKPIRMMGVPRHEVEEVLQNAKKDLRIAGFNEEENRLRQRSSNKPQASIILPKGPYIFCEFRTLQLPGVELNPPASEALKRMHMLASDPGIVAIMNKHRWRVGIMTEMAPVGYVGVSPKCILGLNKNHGEEISLRLRTDDLRGFRKYESIKKTLLHELAHMVFSEHDANFYALDKQLNEEAASLDWTRSRGHTLASVKNSQDYEEEFENLEGENLSRKLGGCTSNQLGSARATSVAAAYNRLANALTVNSEPDPDEGGSSEREELDHEPDSDSDNKNKSEPDPYESQGIGTFESGLGENNGRLNKADSPHQIMVCDEPDPDACEEKEVMKVEPDPDAYQEKEVMKVEPDPDAPRGKEVMRIEPDPDESREKEVMRVEPDHDESREKEVMRVEPDHDESREKEVMRVEPDPDESQEKEVMRVEPDPDESLVINQVESSEMQIDEPDPDDSEIRRIQDSVTVVCSRLQKAIEMLQSEIDDPTAASTVLQTIFKIIRNVIEHPEEIKYRRLRKANPVIQRNIAKYKAAMEILVVIGFMEDVVSNEIGMAETYIVLKRNDPGLLWLAKSSLESCLAC